MDKTYIYKLSFCGPYKPLQEIVDSLHDGSFPIASGPLDRHRRISYNWLDRDPRAVCLLEAALVSNADPQHTREVLLEAMANDITYNVWVDLDSITYEPTGEY